MTTPGLIWSITFLFCLVSAPINLGSANQPIPAQVERVADSISAREIAARCAPIFYQALGDKRRSDYITNFDFDGDWRGDNNWEHTDDKNFPLRAYIYYAVSETQTHFFIHYAVFHPRDYKGGERKGLILSEIIREGTKRGKDHDPTGLMAEAGVAHENDMEGLLIVVSKKGKDPDRAVFMETFHHDDFSPYVPGEAPREFGSFKTDNGHALIYIEPKGHGIEAYSGNEKQTAKKDFLIYKFAAKAEDPDKQPQGPIGYDLLPIQTTLWARAKVRTADKGATYAIFHNYGELTITLAQARGRTVVKKVKIGEIGQAFAGDSGGLNMARPPWAWFDKRRRGDALGLWFFDPARIIKRDFKLGESFSTTYSQLPFWATN
jgi:hypothetical protein